MYSGAVYLKNSIFKYWKERDPNDSVGEELPYSIPEPAKTLIRDNVIGAIIQAPPLIRYIGHVTLKLRLSSDDWSIVDPYHMIILMTPYCTLVLICNCMHV